jgi:hypothetical protein
MLRIYLTITYDRIRLPPSYWRIDDGRSRTAFALQAGIRRAGLRAVPGWRHQPGIGRWFRRGTQHDRQLAAQTPRVRPGGEERTQPCRRQSGARPLRASHRLQLREHAGPAPRRRTGVGAAHGAPSARRQGLHLLAAQPPSAAMAHCFRAGARCPHRRGRASAPGGRSPGRDDRGRRALSHRKRPGPR